MTRLKWINCLISLFLIISSFLSFLPQAYAQSTNEWPTFQQNPQHTGYNSSESTLKPPLKLLWKQPYNSSFVVSDNMLYTHSNGYVVALDTTTGQIMWQTTGVGGPVAVSNGVIYSTDCSSICYVTAYDANTGQLLWTSSDSYGVTGINVVGNTVYLGGPGIVALDATTGNTLWTTGFADGTPSTPAVYNGKVYIGAYQNGGLYAIDANTGSILWNKFYDYVGNVSPSAANGLVYMGSAHNGGITAFDANTGQEKWFDGLWINGFQQNAQSTVAVANGIAYVRADNGRLYALDAITGQRKWTYTPQTSQSANAANNFTIANGIAYIGEGNDMLGFDATTGQKIWDYRTGGQVSNTIGANGRLFFLSQDGYIYAFTNGSDQQLMVTSVTATPNLVLANTQITTNATFTDPDPTTSYFAYWNWGDGSPVTNPDNLVIPSESTPGTITGSHIYSSTGVYPVILTVLDTDGRVATYDYEYVAVYDSSMQFAGGKSYDNPTTANTNTSGKVTFGVNAKFSNSNTLTGNVKMDFKAINLTFVSTSLESLVTTNGKAYLKGIGTINGTGNYTFLVNSIDGSVVGGNDMIRFQIKDSLGNNIYDTQPGAVDSANASTSVATGNIRIH